MVNSLFMLGSSYNKDRKISAAFMFGWIAYMFMGSDGSLGASFPLVNAIVFLALSVIINLVKNRKANTALSICSILIWSVVTDVICYFAYPMLVGGQTLLGYVFQGILFNYKYIISNMIAIGLINAIIWISNNVELKIKKAVRA